MTAAELIDEVRRLGGSIVLILHVDAPPQLDLRIRRDAGWLIEEIRKRKPQVVAEIKRRYLNRVVLSERVQ